MKKLLILITCIFFTTQLFSMDKDIMRSMDDNRESSNLQWNDLPKEIKAEILKFVLLIFIEPRQFDHETHDNIVNIKLLEQNCNNIINEQSFFALLRNYINNNYEFPICLLALAKFVLPKEKNLEIINSAQVIYFPYDFNFDDPNFLIYLDTFIRAGGRVDLLFDVNGKSIFMKSLGHVIEKYLIKCGAHLHESEYILPAVLKRDPNLIKTLVDINKSSGLMNLPDSPLDYALTFLQILLQSPQYNHRVNQNFYQKFIEVVKILLENFEQTDLTHSIIVNCYNLAVENNDLETQLLFTNYLSFPEIIKSNAPNKCIIS